MAAGLLDMFSPEVAQGFAMDPDERKRLLLANALLGISAGALNARKGNELGALGSGLFQGAMAGQQAVSQAQADKYRQFQAMTEGQKVVDQRKAQEQAMRDQQQLSGIFAGGGAPDLTPLANGEGPTVANAAAQAPGSPKGDAYRKAAVFYAERGRTEDAKRMMDLANSFDEEFAQTPQVMMKDGKAINALIGKKGTVKALEGYEPTPKFREVNDGKTTRIINDYTIPQGGANIAMQTTPGQDQANALGWANYGLSKQSADRAAANANAPQLVDGQYFYKPDATNPTGRAVTPAGVVPKAKDLTESQAKATAYVNMMENANRELADLQKRGFTGSGVKQQASIANAGADGIPFVPGSGAVQRMFSSDDAQKFYNAQLQWTEPVLRFQTGANAPKEEVIRNAATYFPRPGDSDAVIAQKAEARTAMEASMRLAAGAGSAKVPERKQEPDAPKVELKKNTTALYKARQAIAQGKDPAAVRQRLIENGIDPGGL